MNFFSNFLKSGTPKQQSSKKLGALLICVTVFLLVIALIVLTIGAIVMKVKANKQAEQDAADTGVKIPNGFTTTTFDATQSVNGDLLLIDADHVYAGTTTAELFDTHETRAKTPDGKKVYTIGGTPDLGATEQTIIAFNAMISDFYADKTYGGDTNLYIKGAYNLNAENQAPGYQTGTVISLNYYVDYEKDKSNIPSIYNVDKYKWIYDHAHEYGFILVSEEEDGPNNVFRYVGVAHSMYMKSKNKTFAEYLTILKDSTSANKPLSITTKDGTKYGFYYLSADTVATTGAIVPSKYTYTVSGDNMGGYIVTYVVSTKN